MERVEYEKLVVQDIISLHDRQDLNLNPWYQRRSVWNNPQKAYLINTMFEQKPIPTIYVRHSLDLEAEKSIREVVDGQQRIRTILEYVEGGFAARHPILGKVKYSELSKVEIQKFRMTSLSVGYLLGATDSDVIEIFGRLNSVSKTLNAQEKRNARFSGDFKQFCLKQAAERVSLWRELQVFSTGNIARMLEVQFISDLVLNLVKGLSDFSVASLDRMYDQNDESFPKEKDTEAKLDKIFTTIAQLSPGVIKDTVFSRQPIFFSLCILLANRKNKISKSALEDKMYGVDQLFEDEKSSLRLSAEATEFIAACTSTTQRIKSRRIRDTYLRKVLDIK